MNKLDRVVTNNIKTNEYQINDAIYNDPMFDTSKFNSYNGATDRLPVVNVTFKGGKKYIASTVAGLTCF